MKKYDLLYLLGLLCCWSCQEQEASHENDFLYEKHGIQFSIPEDWSHSEKPIPGAGIYLTCEKNDGTVAAEHAGHQHETDTLNDESGQFIVSIIFGHIPLSEYMSMMRQQMKDNLMYRNTEISFSEVKEQDFNGAASLSAHFKHQSGGLDYRGELHTFYCGENTIYLFIQEALEDQDRNKKGLSRMAKTFKCLHSK